MYQSEISQFLDQLKQSQPQLEEMQRQGRAIWWDKRVDWQLWQAYQAARVPQQPYVYQPASPTKFSKG